MQNEMLMTSKSKPEVQFSTIHMTAEIGSSFISAVDWDISSKFGMEIDFDLLKQMLSLNFNPEVHFRLYGRHVEKSIWQHNSAADRPITTKSHRKMKMRCRWLHIRQNRNRKYNSNMGAFRFPKPEIVLSPPWIKNKRYLNKIWYATRIPPF